MGLRLEFSRAMLMLGRPIFTESLIVERDFLPDFLVTLFNSTNREF